MSSTSLEIRTVAPSSDLFKDNDLHALRTQIAVLTTVLRGWQPGDQRPTSRSARDDRNLRLLSHVCTLLTTGSRGDKPASRVSAATGFFDTDGTISIVLTRNTSTQEPHKSTVDMAIEGTDNGGALIGDWENHRHVQS